MTQRYRSQGGAAKSPQPRAVHPSLAPWGGSQPSRSRALAAPARIGETKLLQRCTKPTLLRTNPVTIWPGTRQEPTNMLLPSRPCAHLSAASQPRPTAGGIPCLLHAARAAPATGVCRHSHCPPPSRQMCSTEISILGCRKVYLRRVRRDPCREAEDGISSLHLVQLKKSCPSCYRYK